MDITKQVMGRVVALERSRIRRWRVVFWLVVGSISLILVALLVQAFQIVQERGTFDLLSLLGEDREIIAEFWQDSLTLFYEELPRRRLAIALILALTMTVIFWGTRRVRQIIKKKSDQLRQYPK